MSTNDLLASDRLLQRTVVFVHQHLQVGGAEVLRWTMLKRLREHRQYRIVVCCLGHRGTIGDELETLGIRVIYLNAHQKFYNLFTTWKLLQVLRQERPHIVQSSQFDANVHARLAAWWLRVPVVIIEEHGLYRWKRWYHRWIDRALLRGTDAAIAVSKSVEEWLVRQGIAAGKIVVLPNCVDVERFSAERSKPEARRQLGYGADEMIIGTVGTLRWEKGHRYLLEAMRIVADRHPSARLVVVGDGPLRRELEQRVAELRLDGRVDFLGQRRDHEELLVSFDLFVLASVNESFGIALAEAMCAGLPCVATSVGGIPEAMGRVTRGEGQVKEDARVSSLESRVSSYEVAEGGLLVPSADPPALAEAIERLIVDRELAERLGRSAQRRVRERFGVERYLNNLTMLYDRCLHPAPRACATGLSSMGGAAGGPTVATGVL